MLHTPLCDLLGIIEVPITQAPIAPYTSAQLVAAVSNAGGLGSIGTLHFNQLMSGHNYLGLKNFDLMIMS
jgi:NAD(P)H-dependent flavin oxidoreductase YrpB (nitropropane dioxygenase family)